MVAGEAGERDLQAAGPGGAGLAGGGADVEVEEPARGRALDEGAAEGKGEGAEEGEIGAGGALDANGFVVVAAAALEAEVDAGGRGEEGDVEGDFGFHDGPDSIMPVI